MSKQKKNKAPFAVGDRVTTAFHPNADVVRTVTLVRYSLSFGYWGVTTDGGEPCQCCKRAFPKPLCDIDSDWFKLVSETEDKE